MVSIKEILGTDSIAGSRITINNNFSVLKSGLNSILNSIVIGDSGIINITDSKTSPKINLNFSDGISQFTAINVKIDSDTTKHINLNENNLTTGSSISVRHDGNVAINQKLTSVNIENSGELKYNILKTTPINLTVSLSSVNDLLVYSNSNFNISNYSHIIVSGSGFAVNKLFPLASSTHGHVLFIQNKTGVAFDIISPVTTYNKTGAKSTVPSGYLTGYFTVNPDSVIMLLYVDFNNIKSWTKIN